MKRLILMRHAHPTQGGDDYVRVLTPDGQRAARSAAKAIRKEGYAVDTVLCSAALRARETAEIVHDELEVPNPLLSKERLYSAGQDGYLAILGELPDACACVVLVAHNPTISEIAGRLLGRPLALQPAQFAGKSFEISRWADLS